MNRSTRHANKDPKVDRSPSRCWWFTVCAVIYICALASYPMSHVSGHWSRDEEREDSLFPGTFRISSSIRTSLFWSAIFVTIRGSWFSHSTVGLGCAAVLLYMCTIIQVDADKWSRMKRWRDKENWMKKKARWRSRVVLYIKVGRTIPGSRTTVSKVRRSG